MNNKELGSLGEKIAEDYLIKNNFEVLCKNFSCRQGEIDIIAKDKEEIVFVEVKTRSSFKYGTPAEAVNYEKQIHIYKTAKYYLYLCKMEEENIRFDVIEVFFKDRKYFVNHIKQIM